MTIIDNYRKLPLGKYQEIVNICKEEGLEDIDRQLKIISVLTGEDEATLLDLPIAEYARLASASAFLEQPASETACQPARRMYCGDMTLEIVSDIKKITTAQYIDFKTLARDGDTRLVELLSTVLIPAGKQYGKDYDIADVQGAIRESLSVAEALSLLSFFTNRLGRWMASSLTSLDRAIRRTASKEGKEKARKKREELLIAFKEIGDGWPM